MSKESKLRDLHRQSIEAVRDRGPFCPGCGLHATVTGEHRPDCTAHPAPLHCAECDATRPAGARNPVWRYDPRSGYHCPAHQKGAA